MAQSCGRCASSSPGNASNTGAKAVGGVQRGTRMASVPLPLTSDRVSFELSEEALQSLRVKLATTPGLGAFGQRNNHKLNSIHSPARNSPDPEFLKWQKQHPCMLTAFESFAAKARGKRLAVFLDYDGTLTPIVKDPDSAFMSDQMREVVRRIATMFPTAIISGRGREKVEAFVQLQELFYAGSHGMDISGPSEDRRKSLEQLAFRPAARFEPIMQQVFTWLQDRVSNIPGASVEDNKFCVSVHFRNCDEEAWPDVQAAVVEALEMQPELRLCRGRKVLELRPEVEWDKGHALAHLLGALGLGNAPDVLPLYIGDDRTDEDAFRLLAGRTSGFGILVSSLAKPTAAKFTLQNPSEVLAFLQRLVIWGSSDSNAWHQIRSCVGWKITADAPVSTKQQQQEQERQKQQLAPQALGTRSASNCSRLSSSSSRSKNSSSSGGSCGVLGAQRSSSQQGAAAAAAAAALGIVSSGMHNMSGSLPEANRLLASPFGKDASVHTNGFTPVTATTPYVNGFHAATSDAI